MRELRKEEFEENHKKYLAEKAAKDKIKKRRKFKKIIYRWFILWRYKTCMYTNKW